MLPAPSGQAQSSSQIWREETRSFRSQNFKDGTNWSYGEISAGPKVDNEFSNETELNPALRV